MNFSDPTKAVLILASALCSSSVLSAEAEKNAAKATLHPLALSVSKLPRDGFGKGVNPFSFLHQNAVSGTSLLLKVEVNPQFNARLVAADTTLTSLQDDKGLDLLKQANGRGIDQFWEANKKLRVLTSPDGTKFGLQLNAPNTPSAGASKLVAEGSLSFVALDNKATLEHGEVKLTTGETVKTKAAQLKFSKGNGPGCEGVWWMELRPSPEALDVAVKLFGDDEKVPLFDSDGGRTATRTMNGVVSYGFQCPAGKLSRIEIAYAKKGDQIKEPFKVEIGLGDFSGVEQDQGPRRLGPGPRPKLNPKPKGVI